MYYVHFALGFFLRENLSIAKIGLTSPPPPLPKVSEKASRSLISASFVVNLSQIVFFVDISMVQVPLSTIWLGMVGGKICFISCSKFFYRNASRSKEARRIGSRLVNPGVIDKP